MKTLTLNDLKKKIVNFNTFCKFLKDYKYIIDKGRLSEWYCQQLFKLKLQNNPNSPYDATDRQGKKVEIKHRKSPKSGMEIHLDRISYVLLVELNEDLLPRRIYKLDKKDIKQLPNNRVSFNDAFDKKKVSILYKSNEKT